MQDSSATQSGQYINSQDTGLLVALLFFDSMHFIFARLMLPYISPNISAFYVMAISTLELGIYGLVVKKLSLKVFRQNLIFFLSIGILIGISTTLTYLSVAYIDAGTAAMLGKVSVLYGVGFGIFWLKEHFTPIQLWGALLAIAGALIIAFQPGDYLRLGALILMGSTFCYSLHFAIVKRYGGEIDFLNFFFYRVATTSVILLVSSAARGVLEWPTSTAWLVLFLTATFDVVISRGIYYLALRRLNMSLLSVIVTLSPVLSIVWALLLFDTLPTGQQLLGGACVLAGVLVVTVLGRR